MKNWLLLLAVLSSTAFGQGGTTSSDIYPASTGQNLGNSSQRWNLYGQNLDITGTFNCSGLGCPVGSGSGPDGSVQIYNAATKGLGSDPNITINTITHALSTYDLITKNTPAVDVGAFTAGATADVQLRAAIAYAVSRGGGVVDARRLQGAQTIAAKVTIGASSAPVVVLAPTGAIWTCTITNGDDCFSASYGSGVVALVNGWNPSAGFKVVAGSSANISSLWTNADHAGTQNSMVLQGVWFEGSSGETVANGLVWLQALFLPTILRDVVISKPYNTIGLYVVDGNTVQFDNVWANGFSVTGARPVVFKQSTSTSMASFHWVGGGIEHSGSGNPELEINGNGFGASNFVLDGVHFEPTSGDTTDPMIKVVDARGVTVIGSHGSSDGTGAGPYFMDISETVAGLSRNIQVIGADLYTPQFINNHIDGTQLSNTKYGSYFYLRNQGGQNGLFQIGSFSIDGSGIVTVGPNAAQSGQVRVPNDQCISARNNGGSGDLCMVKASTSDGITLGSSYLQLFSTAAIFSGSLQIPGHINQSVSGKFAGTCAMSASTSCTITIAALYATTPICNVTVQGTTAIAGACSVSGSTVTITAASSNSETWGAVLIGNPN